MAKPASFEELDHAISNVLDAETTNFFELAEMLGLNPKHDFSGADLSGTDFSKGNLAGANFIETNLCGANFSYANLQGANLTNAYLGILPSSYLARANKLNRTINLARVLAHVLALKHIDDLTSDIAIAIALTRNLTRASEIANDLASNSDGARSLVFTLADNLTHILALIHDPNSSSSLSNNIPTGPPRLANTIAGADRIANDLAIASTIADNLVRTIEGRANFYRANLSGVILDGANVDGAILTGCIGLSDSEIADLKRRGAIFDNAPGDRAEVRVLVPR